MKLDYLDLKRSADQLTSYAEALLFAARVARLYGIEHVALFASSPGNDPVGFHNYLPGSWSESRIGSLAESPNDTALQHARQGGSTALWDTSTFRSGVIGFAWTPVLKATLGYARDDGVRGGITVPYANGHGRYAYLNFTSTSIGTVRDLAPIAPELNIIGGAIHAALAGVDAAKPSTLSSRELFVLRRRLDGCRTTDIANELGVAPSTVIQFVKRAAQKLGVPQRRVVAEATRLQLL